MINIISQNGIEKISAESYYVAPTAVKEGSGESGTHSIYVLVPGYNLVEVAQYDDESRAKAVFMAMVEAEIAGRPYRMPEDSAEGLERSASGELF